MLLLAATVLAGFFPKPRQRLRYWIHGLLAVVIQSVTQLLFSAGGTLSNVAADGLITRVVRHATSDGPAMLLMLIPAIGFGWVLPLYLLKRGHSRFKRVEAEVIAPT